MRILILGATGGTGREILRELAKRDTSYEVVVVVRSASKLTDEDRASITNVIEGDVCAPEIIHSALEPAPDAVVIAVGNSVLTRAQTVREDVTRSVINAMKEANCTARVVVVSALGAGDSHSQFGFFTKPFVTFVLHYPLIDHTNQERLIKDELGEKQWLVVRPTGLTDKPGTGEYAITTEGIVRSTRIPRADVAHYVINQLENVGESKFGHFVTITS